MREAVPTRYAPLLEKLYIDLPGLRPESARAYLLATVIIAGATLLRVALDPWLVGVQFITLFPTVILITFVCGATVGFFAVALAALSAWFFLIPPTFSFRIAEAAQVYGLVFFVFIASIDVLIVGTLRAALARMKDLSILHVVAFDSNPDAILVVDRAGRIVRANDRTVELFGYPRDALINQPIEMLLPDSARAAHISHRGIFVANPRRRQMGAGSTPLARRADGSEFPVAVQIGPVQLGGEVQVIANVRDLTQTTAIEAQLRQAQKMEAIGNLTGGMAHDFNNLLGIIIGNLDLLRDRQSGDHDANELSREALEAALRGADLTRRLLAFARRQPLQPVRTDVNELIAGIVKLLERTLGEQIRITLDLSPDTWPVVVDPVQLESSLTNLATNARDAMPGGGQLIIVTGYRSLDADYALQHADVQPGDYAMIEVSDTGTGMPPELVSHIFEPFYTSKEEGKGTGLGLSMVFGFMKQSGGHINVYSEVGIGTIFRLYLPRAETGAEASGAIVPAALVRGSGETVLAVEDNASLRQVVVRQLTEMGYHVLEAEDAQTALRVLESERVDLLFTDIVMPGGTSGYDIACTALSRWPAIKIVLTSGFPENRINGDANAPNLRLLSKPYRRDDLGRVIRDVLDS